MCWDGLLLIVSLPELLIPHDGGHAQPEVEVVGLATDIHGHSDSEVSHHQHIVMRLQEEIVSGANLAIGNDSDPFSSHVVTFLDAGTCLESLELLMEHRQKVSVLLNPLMDLQPDVGGLRWERSQSE